VKELRLKSPLKQPILPSVNTNLISITFASLHPLQFNVLSSLKLLAVYEENAFLSQSVSHSLFMMVAGGRKGTG
jgi:hypothetical protein